MYQLDLFNKGVEPKSDLEKLDETINPITSDVQDQIDIINFDIQSASEAGDTLRLSQLIELKNSYSN